MDENITRQWLRANGFGELLDAERQEERERLLGVLGHVFRAGLGIDDDLVRGLLDDAQATPDRAAARLFERGLQERELAEARERALRAQRLQDLRDAEARLAPHVPSPDTGEDEGEDFGALIRRAGDAAAAARGGVR